MRRNDNVNSMVMAALMMAMITVCTMFIKIPTPSGYVHLGTMVVILAIAILGWKYGVIAGAVGTALADLISGYAIWAPGSFAVVFVTALIYGYFIDRTAKKHGGIRNSFDIDEILGSALAVIIFTLGYFIYGGAVVYGWSGALLVVIPNLLQVVTGVILGRVFGTAICKAGGSKYFKYRFISK